MLPSYPFHINVTPQSCHQIHRSFNQRPIVHPNNPGFNVDGNNIKQHVPSMHYFQQHNSSISKSNTCNNPHANVYLSCQHASKMATAHDDDFNRSYNEESNKMSNNRTNVNNNSNIQMSNNLNNNNENNHISQIEIIRQNTSSINVNKNVNYLENSYENNNNNNSLSRQIDSK